VADGERSWGGDLEWKHKKGRDVLVEVCCWSHKRKTEPCENDVCKGRLLQGPNPQTIVGKGGGWRPVRPSNWGGGKFKKKTSFWGENKGNNVHECRGNRPGGGFLLRKFFEVLENESLLSGRVKKKVSRGER